MTKKKRKKIKNKKKLIISLVLIFIGISILITISFFTYKNYKDKLRREKENEILNTIKENYSETVKFTKDTNLYILENNEYVNVGKIYKDNVIDLETTEIKTFKDQYFKIENSEFYVKYIDVTPTDKISEDKRYKNYVIFNNNLITKDNFKIENNNFILDINKSMEFKIIMKNDEYYYVMFNNKLSKIKKEYESSVIESINTDIEVSEKISILNYGKLYDSENCSDERCFSIKNIKEHLNYLKENNYLYIIFDEYIMWLKQEIRLPKNTVMITINEENNYSKNLQEEYNAIINLNNNENLKLSLNNRVSSLSSKIDALDSYKINKTTTLDTFKKMMVYETIIEPKKEVIPVVPKSSDGTATSIAVLNYHFFYDKTYESCNESICLEVNNFRKQLQYLKDNGFKTLTMEEFRAWMYGEISLPEKSVLLTIDDGALGTDTHLIKLLEEYNMNATLFLITAWWPKEKYLSRNLGIESHGHDIHNEGLCSGVTRGARGLCINSGELLSDLNKSIEILGTNTAFCYPFYAYNNSMIETVKNAGFKLGFIGGNYKANRKVDKFKVPRYIIYKNTSLQQFINMVN